MPKIFPSSPQELRKFGIQEKPGSVRNLEELRNSPHNIVVAEALINILFSQNRFRPQQLKKKLNYVMGLGVYEQLKYDEQRDIKVLRPSDLKFKKLYRPYIGQNLANKRLMVWRTGGIGDLLFIQPNLKYLKELYPTCEIIIGCGPQYQAMVEDWDCIDEVVDLPFPTQYLMRANYHAIFEGVIERCLEAHTTNAYNLFTRWLGLNLPNDKLIPTQKVKEEKLEECKKILSEFNLEGMKFTIIQMRASSPIRTPNPKVWAEIIDQLTKKDHAVVITDAAHASESIDVFIKHLIKDKDLVFNFAKYSTSLDYTIALTSLAELAISTDTALVHIAAALGVKSFGLYGPFPGEIRLSTYPKARWINAEHHCAPCFLHGHLSCPNSDIVGCPQCYNRLNIDEVVRRLEEMYAL